MIRSLRLKFGRTPNSDPQNIATTPVTVFVGPNNSGKSKALHEILRYATSGQPSTNDVILADLHLDGLSREDAEQRVAGVRLEPLMNETIPPDCTLVGKRGKRYHLQENRLIAALMQPHTDAVFLATTYFSFNTMFLDGKSRIGLVQPQPAGDLQAAPTLSLQTLFRDDNLRAELRRIIHDAFGLYLVVDPTHLGQFRFRLSSVPPPSNDIERGIHNEAVRFHANAIPIEHGSDGLKAFTGMMSEILAGDPIVLLIDEPEAFLHPALAFLLGKEIARATAKADKRLFVSTHSPNFVMGCIQSGSPITLIRLTYKNGVATARALASSDVLKLMRNPLLRSTGVLSALFYESVIVTESDADRAFYQEINERLLRETPSAGIPNCLFINAQNKQTVPMILRPLRELGIPAAGIVDVDVLKDGGKVWTSFMDGAFIPELERSPTAMLRSEAMTRFNAIEAGTGKKMKRDGGIDLLAPSDREAISNLFARLGEYGLFVVPRGELESWLKHLDVNGHGPQWLVSMFEKLGEDPQASSYVHPGTDDVWEFMRDIQKWFSNPRRKGIPG